jgi:hypothetical protein
MNYKSMSNFPGEVWENISWTEGRYQVSNMGRVKSLQRKVWRLGKGNVRVERTVNEAILSKSITNHGYPYVLMSVDNKNMPKVVHRLVAEAFVEVPKRLSHIDRSKLVVDHINFDKNNSRADNLQWLTQEENLKRSHDSGNYSTRMEPVVAISESGKRKKYTTIADCMRDLELYAGSVQAQIKGKIKKVQSKKDRLWYTFERIKEN